MFQFRSIVSRTSLRRFCTTTDIIESKFIGVSYSESDVKKYKTGLLVDSKWIDGGSHWTQDDAARAYDDLVKMYLGSSAPTNFSDEKILHLNTEKQETEWSGPHELPGPSLDEFFPTTVGQYLDVSDVVKWLEHEKAENVHTIDLEGKSSVGHFMVFCTGRSRGHMRKMADGIVDALRLRNLKDGVDYGVEGRDCDDWMIVDGTTIIVQIMNKFTRNRLQLEDHWEHMRNNQNTVYGHMSEDEYMAKYGKDVLHEEEPDTYIVEEGDWK